MASQGCELQRLIATRPELTVHAMYAKGVNTHITHTFVQIAVHSNKYTRLHTYAHKHTITSTPAARAHACTHTEDIRTHI